MNTVEQVEIHTRLSPEQVQAVFALTDAAGDTDGSYPLSEHVVLHLRHGGDADVRHLLLRASGAVAGYAHVDVSDQVEGARAELAVHPAHRRRGLGRRLVEAAVAASPDGRLRLWAHGEHPAAAALAQTLGFRRSRVLFQLRRSLYAPVPAPALAEGIRLRTFVVDQDEPAWVALNSRAFADHPEQGGWTERDVRLREAEPWFDAAGFLLAERESDGALVGFHWTKVHGAAPAGTPSDTATRSEHAHEPIGEVYVLGVDPPARGLGLGPALTLAGLRYLRGRGLSQAMLYVDESNARAVDLYTKLGFSHWSTDISFTRNGE